MPNTKKTSIKIASLAADILNDSNASKIQKKLAGSALSQSQSGNQTGSELENVASKVLNSDKYSSKTKKLAASVLSQSNKNR
jgi:hypothetical protein